MMPDEKNMNYLGKGFSSFKTKGFKGFNLDRNIYIQCEKCGDFISLHPRNKEFCACNNIIKDIDAGIFECKTGFENAKIFEIKKIYRYINPDK